MRILILIATFVTAINLWASEHAYLIVEYSNIYTPSTVRQIQITEDTTLPIGILVNSETISYYYKWEPTLPSFKTVHGIGYVGSDVEIKRILTKMIENEKSFGFEADLKINSTPTGFNILGKIYPQAYRTIDVDLTIAPICSQLM